MVVVLYRIGMGTSRWWDLSICDVCYMLFIRGPRGGGYLWCALSWGVQLKYVCSLLSYVGLQLQFVHIRCLLLVYVIQVCWQLASRIRTELVWFCCCITYTMAVCTVKNSWWWTEELSETCRILFRNKVEKLVHLVGFIIRIFHDARLPELQISLKMALYTSRNT